MSSKKPISAEEAVDSANDILAAKRAKKTKMDSLSNPISRGTVDLKQRVILKGINRYPGKILGRNKHIHRHGLSPLSIQKGVKWDDIPQAVRDKFRFVDEDFE